MYLKIQSWYDIKSKNRIQNCNWSTGVMGEKQQQERKKKIFHLHKKLRPVTTFIPSLLTRAISTEAPKSLKHNATLIFLFLGFALYSPCLWKHTLLMLVSGSFSECHHWGPKISTKPTSTDCCYVMISIVPLKQFELSRGIELQSQNL